MKKNFKVFVAFALTFFIVPFIGQAAFADAKVYDDIEDGNYSITVKTLHETENKPSGAANFINEDANLSIKDGKAELTITIPENPMASVTGLQIGGIKPVVKGTKHTFALNDLKALYNARVQYEVPSMNMDHDVALRISLEGLDKLPVMKEEVEDDPVVEEEDSEEVTEEETEEPEAEENGKVEGTLIQNADEIYSINYVSDISIDRNFDNPVKLLHKDGKKYIQISGNGAQFIKSLTINGKEVTWGKINADNTYVIQFEINDITDELNFGMTIDTGRPGADLMQHNAKLTFDESTKELIEGSKEEPVEKPEEDTEKPVEKPTEKPAEKPSKKPTDKKDETANLTPDKAYSINYVIKHENGVQESVANDFFTGKATLLEKDGKTYVQMTITNGDMVKGLSNKYGDALIVKKNKDGSIVVQLRVDNNLSNSLLDMSIVVPGLYSSDHKAQLVFDKNSKKAIEVGGVALVGTNNPNNTSGPTVEDGVTPVKPTFGDGKKSEQTAAAANVKSKKGENPQTGDTTNIILFALLLVGSSIPLIMQARRRFV